MPKEAGAATERLDLRGLKCPLPALKAEKRLGTLASGAIVEIVADDPLAGLDIAHLCRERGHRLLKVTQENGMHRLVVQRS